MMLLKAKNSRSRKLSGFSLIEVLVAVVILATGLLALAALQGALARNSSDAKARSAVISALTSRMAQHRQGIATLPDGPCSGAGSARTCAWTEANATWVSSAAELGGISGLKVSEKTLPFRWESTQAKFVGGEPTSGVQASFIRVEFKATWIDAAGADRTLALQSDTSRTLLGTGTGYDNPPSTSSASVRPIVRQANPANQPGVIPIAAATQNGTQATAASNPKPLKLGATTAVGTQFDVLTYVPEGALAKLTARTDTNMVKCRCSLGQSSPNKGVAGVAQWPTVWDGNQYRTYKPTSGALPPAATLNAGENPAYAGTSNRKQSPLCTECCRDHHDTVGMAVRFSPEGGTSKYDADASGTLIPTAVTGGTYVAACRVIKNDGIWKTAADMYVRQYGLLATTPDPVTAALVSNPELQARSGAPDTRAVDSYQRFIKNYLAGYVGNTTGLPPKTLSATNTDYSNHEDKFLESPVLVSMPGVGQEYTRYLHSRALLADYLNEDARKAMKKAVDNCFDSSKKVECLLPHLSFTTINMTELTKWTSLVPTKLNVVASNIILGTNVSEPFGGRTWGRAPVSSDAPVKSEARVTVSNSSLAASNDLPWRVRPVADEAETNDTQDFSVGGTVTNDAFFTITASGLAEATSTVTVTRVTPAGSCPGDATGWTCDFVGPMTLRVGVFNKNVAAEDPLADSVTVTCPVPQNQGGGTTQFVTKRPYRIRYGTITATPSSPPSSQTFTVPTGQNTVNEVVNWVVPGGVTTGQLAFSNRTKTCPSTYNCNNGNWGNVNSYSTTCPATITGN